MSQVPGQKSPRFAYVVMAVGGIEVIVALWLATVTGYWWVLLLGIFAIPNFVLGYQTLRSNNRS